MILQIWNNVVALGTVEEEVFVRAKRKTISTNLAALTISTVAVPFILFYYYLDLDDLAALLFIVTFLIFHTVVLNYLGLIVGAKLWFVSVTNFSAFYLPLFAEKIQGFSMCFYLFVLYLFCYLILRIRI